MLFLPTEDKTVAAAPSEASLREMNEGFPAPSTFSEKAPTHKESPPASLRQTMMGIGNTPPVRPLPLPPPGRSTGSLAVTPAPAAAQPGAPRPSRPTGDSGAGRPSYAAVYFADGSAAVCAIGGAVRARAASSGPAPDLTGSGRTQRAHSGGFCSCHADAAVVFPCPALARGSTRGRRPFLVLAFPASPMACRGRDCRAGWIRRLVAAAALSLRPPSRIKYYLLFLAFMALGGGGAYLYLTRSGKMQIGVKPADARVTVDGVALHEGPPYVIERRPGIYHVAVAREGYVPREQDVEIRTAQVERVEIEMEASPDTGFELTSQPPGGLVWLDGQAFVINETGKQATTNFRASRITPGRHVLEIKGDPRFKDWRQEIFQEPGQTLKINAAREPGGAPARSGGTVAAGARPSSTPAPSLPAAGPSAVAENRGRSSSGSRRASRAAARAEGASDDVLGGQKLAGGGKNKEKAGSDEDVFEHEGRLGAGGGEECVANIGSKPWAQVAIDGKPTGKSTPLIDYSLACGKHRITFTNSDLMIERNEIIILKPGQRFKKIFPLVDMDF